MGRVVRDIQYTSCFLIQEAVSILLTGIHFQIGKMSARIG
jgi:hypothetical protein